MLFLRKHVRHNSWNSSLPLLLLVTKLPPQARKPGAGAYGGTMPKEKPQVNIAEAMDISLADFFPGTETPRDKETQKMLGELSQDEIRFLVEIKRYSSTLSDGDKRLVLAMIRKMATMIPPPVRKPLIRRPAV